MNNLTVQAPKEYHPIILATVKVLVEVMAAGAHQRESQGKPTDEWTRANPTERLHHAFMHLVTTQSHIQSAGNPWSLTKNTQLERY